LAQQPGIYEYAGLPVADSAADQGRGYGRIDPTRQSTHDVSITGGPTDVIHGGIDERFHRPVAAEMADTLEEVLEDLFSLWGVCDLRMKLKAVKVSSRVLSGGDGPFGCGGYDEAARRRAYVIPMAHPGLHRQFQSDQELTLGLDFHVGVSIFAPIRWRD